MSKLKNKAKRGQLADIMTDPTEMIGHNKPPEEFRITPTPDLVYTIQEFCAVHKISVPFFFKLRNQDLGPAEMKVGARVLITSQSAAAWRAEREFDTRRKRGSAARAAENRPQSAEATARRTNPKRALDDTESLKSRTKQLLADAEKARTKK